MSNTRYDVVVVGGTGIDTNVYLPGRDIDFGVEANFTENLDYVGQAGAYSARGFARLGKRTALIDYLGDDYHGAYIRQELHSDGIDLSGVFLDPSGTRRSVNFMYRDGRRKNFYDGKGSMNIRPDIPACRKILTQTRLAHFTIINWTRYLLPIARELGLTVACDLQDVVSLDDPYRKDYIDHADVLFFSAVNHEDPRDVMTQLIAAHPTVIVIAGRGAAGCALGTSKGIRFYQAVDLPAPIVDTNGAGDALAVGFLSSYCLDGYSAEDSVVRGQIAARHACALRADSSMLITAEELDSHFQTQQTQLGT